MADANFLTFIGNSLWASLESLWVSFMNIIPGLIAALVVLIIGWIVAVVIKHIIERVIKLTPLDEKIESMGLQGALGGIHLSKIIASFAKWYVIVIFLAQAVALINLDFLQIYAGFLVSYIPRVLAAIIAVLIGLLIGKYVRNLLEMTSHRFKKTAGVAAEVFVVYLATVIGLQTIGFEVTILLDAFRIAFAALAITLAIVIGVSFGLAFRKDAKTLVNDMKKEFG